MAEKMAEQMADKPRVIVTRRLPDEVEVRLSELFAVTLNQSGRRMPRAELLAAASACDVLCPTLGDMLDADFFAAAGPDLKLIANFGAGVDHIDISAATARNITVTNTPSVLAQDVADMAMALIIAVPRRLVEGVEALKADKFSGWSPTWMLGTSVRHKKLGIIGLGRVGQEIAERAKSFGLDVHYHNRNRINLQQEEQLGVSWWPSLDQMLSNMDIISVNCPHTPATYHLLSRRRLALLQPHAYVINVSRGEVIDETALADMIEGDKLGGAALDVFEHEPRVNPKLLAAKNVVLLPHMASATKEARTDMGARMLINIKMFLDGHKPPDRIIPEMQ